MLALAALGCGRAEGGRAGPGATAGAQSSGGGTGKGGTDSKGGAEAGPDGQRSYVELEGAPIYTRVQRLTSRQWEHAVTDILRFTVPHDLSKTFVQPVSGVTDFDNNEKLLFIARENLPDFELGAEAAAKLATSSAEALAALDAGTDAPTLVRTLGRRAFRRPLTDAEQTKYEALFGFGEQLYGAGFANGAALVIRALLQSPHFLYRTELGTAGQVLTGYEIASKLSFWLLGTTPSDALLDLASKGDLERLVGVLDVAGDMLEDPRAVETMRDFHEQLLYVRRYGEIDKIAVPDFDAAVKSELVPASDAFFDRVFTQGLGLDELLTSSSAYVGPGLARLYGLDPPQSGLELRALGGARAGYFMQVPFLMLGSASEQSNIIQRAVGVKRISCGSLGLPLHPIPLPPLQPGQTNRQLVSKVSEECGSACHAVLLDPLGFALEGFDGLGRERDRDNGAPIDTTGSYPFSDGVVNFADGTELMNAMAASVQTHTCYARKVTSYALGRDIVEADRPLLESLAGVSQTESLKELALALVRAPAFRTREERLP